MEVESYGKREMDFSTFFDLNLAAKICSDICPWTLSVPRSEQFSETEPRGKLFASRNR